MLTESLDTFHEILTVETHPGEDDYLKTMSLKKEVAQSVVATAVKLKDLQMERQNTTAIERLLEDAKRVRQETAAARLEAYQPSTPAADDVPATARTQAPGREGEGPTDSGDTTPG